MTPDELLEQIRSANTHERSTALRIAVPVWREQGLPAGFEDLMRDMVSNALPGLSRPDIHHAGSLWSDVEAERFVRKFIARTHALETLLIDRDPAAFLSLIADIRDSAITPMAWWPADVSPLLSALHVADSPSPELLAGLLTSASIFLFIGASRTPGKFIPVRTITRHRNDPGVPFAEFALSNPYLSPTDREFLLQMMHPTTVAAAREAVSAEEFDHWLLSRLNTGTEADVLALLASELGRTAVAASDRALRIALTSSLASIRELGLWRLEQLLEPADVTLGQAVYLANDVPSTELTALVAACRRNSPSLAHSRP